VSQYSPAQISKKKFAVGMAAMVLYEIA